jgi:hypothetical protein
MASEPFIYLGRSRKLDTPLKERVPNWASRQTPVHAFKSKSRSIPVRHSPLAREPAVRRDEWPEHWLDDDRRDHER